MKTLKNNYDSPWKDILDIYLHSFLELCFPAIAENIDWDKGYQLLDKELQTISKNAVIGFRIVDKLVKVCLKEGGKELWVLLHIEVQGQPINKFELRILICKQRIFEKYQKPVVSLAILTDPTESWRPHRYSENLWGCRLDFEFPIIKLLDYKSRQEELEKSNNPFAIVILAQLAALEKYPHPETKLIRKIAISRKLYEHGWSKQDVLNLYHFIDWVILLPKELEQPYQQAIETIEENKKMRYVTTAERLGIEKGMAKGFEQGIQQGMQQGLQKGEQTLLLRQLKLKFSMIPKNYLTRIKQADTKLLLKWGERILEAKNLEEIFS